MLSVVVPALNERSAISETVSKIRVVLAEAGIPSEIIVVDDGSTDDTAELAVAAGARVIRHPHNVGYGRSLKDGILAARYETIAITDADGTYPVQELPRLLAMKKLGYDMVVGARTGQFYRESVIKSPLRYLLRLIVEWTAGRRIPDINSGLRVFSRDLTMSYFSRLCDTFSFTTSLTLAYMMNSKFVTYTEIDYYERIGKTRVRLFQDTLKTLQFIIEAAVFYNPLRIFLLFSMMCVGAAGISLAVGLITHRASFFMLGVGGILAGVIVMSLGLVCTLLRQIMDGAASSRAALQTLPTRAAHERIAPPLKVAPVEEPRNAITG